MHTAAHKRIIEYYETCEKGYRQVWDLNRSHAMHFGFWDAGTRTLPEALHRENEVLAERARIRQSDRVLDAGCGVGGSSIFLAQTAGCEVVGITLSSRQATDAAQNAERRGAAGVRFEVMDFEHTSFDDGAFSVVWAIESVCHARDKRQFVREAYRLLRPGGRLIIADGFARKPKDEYVSEDALLMRRWLRGWAVSSLDTPSQFVQHAKEAGFHNIAFDDMTARVRRSARRLYWISLGAIPVGKVERALGRITRAQMGHSLAAYYQYKALRRDLWQYGIFYAEKG